MDTHTSKFRVTPVAETLHVRTVEVLRQAILDGHFKPGERLVERKLCDLTGVGRSSIREALRQLDGEQLIEYTPNRGPRVTVITYEKAAEIYEVRGAVEGLAIRLFVARASDPLIRKLERVVGRYEKAMRAQKLDEIIKTTDEFFQVLTEGARNDLLANFSTTLRRQMRFLRAFLSHRQSPAQRDAYVRTFRAMVTAIAARNADAAYLACQDNIDHAASVALSALQGD